MVEDIKLDRFSKEAGVYLFKTDEEVIYIGSSKNLYNRMTQHISYIRKGLKAKRNPALYRFLQSNPFTVEFQLTDDYRQLEQQFIEKYHPTYNSHRAYTGLGPRKGREAEYWKEFNNQYYESHNKEILEQKKQYYNQQCLYNGKILAFGALKNRFKRMGIPHPTAEAKKYLIKD